MKNKMYSIMILKPDVFENDSFNELSKLLSEHRMFVQATFLIEQYAKFSMDYRKYDLSLRFGDQPKEYERNFKRNMVAITAYQMEYKDEEDKGIVMVVNNTYDSDDEFYLRLSMIKTQLREIIEEKLGHVTYLYMGQDPWFTFKDKRNRLEQLRTKENKSVDIAYINVIHLEDRELFNIDACTKFVLDCGIINKKNIIHIKELNDNYDSNKKKKEYEIVR